MDLICRELGIPRKQIKATNKSDRFIVAVHNSWLKSLLNRETLECVSFSYDGLDIWNSLGSNLVSWTKVYIRILNKQPTVVIPLPRSHSVTNPTEQPLSFCQLLHYVAQSNHKNLWKDAHKQYTSSLGPPKDAHAINPLPYNCVLREIISRTYGCVTLNKVDNSWSDKSHNSSQLTLSKTYESHCNIYPVTCAIETESCIFLIHESFIEHTVMDCLSYTPALMELNYNKSLFIVYQLLNALKSMHDRGLIMGNITLSDIFVTENLWIQIMPEFECNMNVVEPNFCKNDKNHSLYKSKCSFGVDGIKCTKSQRNVNSVVCRCSDCIKILSSRWVTGSISNFDYLTALNELSGRRKGDPINHHVMPWVTDFTSRCGNNWRDLTKSKYRLNKGDRQLDLTFSLSPDSSMDESLQTPHHVSDVLSDITYYVYMARRTDKAVLMKYVRSCWVPAEYPSSIQRLQQWTPDECIPEFYCDPTVFRSIHEDLLDLEVPAWATCTEDFIAKHREALESQYVSERLHHWIDLTFGYKLTGSAAVKAKNVCLSLVDKHGALSKGGVVQLFDFAHPARYTPGPFDGKYPPRIYINSDRRRSVSPRLTRSSEDLSWKEKQEDEKTLQSSNKKPTVPSSKPLESAMYYGQYRNTSETISNYHTVPKSSTSSSTIHLPKEFNPALRLTALECQHFFAAKTFHQSKDTLHNERGENNDCNCQLYSTAEHIDEVENAFTNRIFAESYEEILKEKDRSRVLHKNSETNVKIHNCQHNTSYKYIKASYRLRELQVLGCIIVEIFLLQKLRPLGLYVINTFNDRLLRCITVAKHNSDLLPKCVKYTVSLLLQIDLMSNYLNDDCVHLTNYQTNFRYPTVTARGLPPPSAHQLLQPFLSNSLIPFPTEYTRCYSLLSALWEFSSTSRYLEQFYNFECDGKHCSKYETIEKTKMGFTKKIAECKVKCCASELDMLLDTSDYEQFTTAEIVLPHIKELLENPDTAILSAWYLFDPIAKALGPQKTAQHLLDPILKLYECYNWDECNENLYNNSASDLHFTVSAIYQNKKCVKLYHHSFLLRLIVRLGLKCFLDNFIAPLIEAVGGYRDIDKTDVPMHVHNINQEFKKSKSNKNLKYCDATLKHIVESDTILSPDVSEKSVSSDKTLSPSDVKTTLEKVPTVELEVFHFDDDKISPNLISKTTQNSSEVLEQEDDSDRLYLIDQLELNSEAGSTLDLHLNHSHAEEATEDNISIEPNYKLADFIYGEGQSQFYADLNTNISPNRLNITAEYFAECNPNLSFDDDSSRSFDTSPCLDKSSDGNMSDNCGPKSPTIPIPVSYKRSEIRVELNTIGCEIGSKKSTDSSELLLEKGSINKIEKDESGSAGDLSAKKGLELLNYEYKSLETPLKTPEKIPRSSKSLDCDNTIKNKPSKSIRPHRAGSSSQYKISDMSADSIVWLSHRLGPVLTSRHLARNLLKMLTLCYVGQENLEPFDNQCPIIHNLDSLTIASGRLAGDLNACKVLECLTSITALYGEQIILRQYLPHMSEMIAVCRRRLSPSLQGGLLGCMHLLKHLLPFLGEKTLMRHLQGSIVKSVLLPCVRLLNSTRIIFPGGSKARGALARKFLDTLYALAIRIGAEMTREYLLDTLQRFFLIFDKAVGKIRDTSEPSSSKQANMTKEEVARSLDESYLEIRRDGTIAEWCVKGSPLQFSHIQRSVDSQDSPPVALLSNEDQKSIFSYAILVWGHSRGVVRKLDNLGYREDAQERFKRLELITAVAELQEVFNPNLALAAYIPFLRHIGEMTMEQSLSNHALIRELCQVQSQNETIKTEKSKHYKKSTRPIEILSQYEKSLNVDVQSGSASSFGSNTAVIGNRIEVQRVDSLFEQSNLMGTAEMEALVSSKTDGLNSSRHLHGNWLAYWDHENGRPDKDNRFNVNQIKLQSFNGHTHAVRALVTLDNENSFMSGSRDKTVKLWTLRSQGDGSTISNCQWQYYGHKKSILSLAFLEGPRLAVSCDSAVHIWDPFIGCHIASLESSKHAPVNVVRSLPAPCHLVLAGTTESTVRVIDTRVLRYTQELKVAPLPSGLVRCICVSPSGSWVAAGLSSGCLALLEPRTGSLRAIWKAHDGELLQIVALSEDVIVSSSLDHALSAWCTRDGKMLFQLKGPTEPVHCLTSYASDLISGTTANRIGVHSSVANGGVYSTTKLRSETFRGVLTSMTLLPLNRLLLLGSDSGNITLIC